MGEEEKKPEEAKAEEKKPEAAAAPAAEEKKEKEAKPEEKPAEEEKKGDEKEAKEPPPPPPPPPPTEVVLKVFMHCEGCARKVRRCLKGFDGVEDVITDCKTSKVVVKGEKAAADPLKVLNRVQRKSHRQVELISPIPKPPEPKEEVKEEKPKPEEKKEEPPKVIVAVIKVHMHCEACAQEIKKRIQRMKGVESAEPDLKSSQVAVKGIFDPSKLVEYVYKRTGKHAVIVKQEPEEKKEEGAGGEEKPKDDAAAPKEEKKSDEPAAAAAGDGEKKGEEEKKDGGEAGKTEGGGEAAKPEGGGETEETKVMEMKRNEYYYYPPRYAMELYAYPPPPQIFSDENPNACSVM